MTYTTFPTIEGAKSEMSQESSTGAPKEKVSLWGLVLLGFLSSLALISALCYGFAAYTTQSPSPLGSQTPLTTAQQSDVLRNAVTAAAALGVGVTLLLTYRRQRATEENLSITNSLLELQQRQHDIQVVSGLRDRYSLAAEQLGSEKLPLAIAGVHSVESLTDEWYAQCNAVERQNCVSLLTEFLRLAKKEEDNLSNVGSLITATILGRLKTGLAEGRYWGLRINMAYHAPSNISDLYVGGAQLDLRGIRAEDRGDYDIGLMNRWHVVAGSVDLTDLQLDLGNLLFQDSVFQGGSIKYNIDENGRGRGRIDFNRCTFSGTILENVEQSRDALSLTFNDCRFEGGSFTFASHQRPKSLSFVNCTFDKNIFAGFEQMSGFESTELFIENCEFADGLQTLETRKAPEAPAAPRRDAGQATSDTVLLSQPAERAEYLSPRYSAPRSPAA